MARVECQRHVSDEGVTCRRGDCGVVPTVVAAVMLVAWARGTAASTSEWRQVITALQPLHRQAGLVAVADWPSVTNEPGQTFAEYTNECPQVPTTGRRTICLQPLGSFGTAEWAVAKLTANFLGRFYGLPVRMEAAMPLSQVPGAAWSTNAVTRRKQLDAVYVLKNVLRPRVPGDACMYLAITTSVFQQCTTSVYMAGQASTRERMGICSMAYSGRSVGSQSNLFLLRTLKVASHECGHMVTMNHCTKYRCGMRGVSSGPDGEEEPLEFCPECMAKLCWAVGYEPIERFRKLRTFCTSYGLVDEELEYTRFITKLTAPHAVMPVRPFEPGPPKNITIIRF